MERSNSFLYHMKQKQLQFLVFLNPLPRNTKEDTICFQTNDVKFLSKLKCLKSRMSSGIWPYPNSSSNHPVAVLDS